MQADDQGEQIPAQLVCPITQLLFKNPVVAMDGHTYQKVQIEKWFQNHDISPLTGLPLSNKALIPNYTLKKAIHAYQEKTSDSQKERQIQFNPQLVQKLSRMNIEDRQNSQNTQYNGTMAQEMEDIEKFRQLGLKGKQQNYKTQIQALDRVNKQKELQTKEKRPQKEEKNIHFALMEQCIEYLKVVHQEKQEQLTHCHQKKVQKLSHQRQKQQQHAKKEYLNKKNNIILSHTEQIGKLLIKQLPVEEVQIQYQKELKECENKHLRKLSQIQKEFKVEIQEHQGQFISQQKSLRLDYQRKVIAQKEKYIKSVHIKDQRENQQQTQSKIEKTQLEENRQSRMTEKQKKSEQVSERKAREAQEKRILKQKRLEQKQLREQKKQEVKRLRQIEKEKNRIHKEEQKRQRQQEKLSKARK